MDSSIGDFNRILIEDARAALKSLPPNSVDLSFWSPPYHVGKSYEEEMCFEDWKALVRGVIASHKPVMRPGAFIVVNIADILCFSDPDMPRFQADNLNGKRIAISREQLEEVMAQHPTENRHQIAARMGCSEQTIQRRLQHNNVRGGRQEAATKIVLTGCMIAEWAEESGFHLYDKRIWHKDPAWANGKWHSNSYRAVDEFEHLYVFWKPGITKYDRSRLDSEEWAEWGSRGVWKIPSVRRNRRHEAEFPELLAERVIRLFSPLGGVVIDPFVGTGTTTAVARNLGRQWLGIESNPTYAQIAEERTRAASPN